MPCDDSVVRLVTAEPETDAAGQRPDQKEQILPIRRCRGYAPYPVAVAFAEGPSILAVGGELKATFCLRRDGHAFMSQHLGDMADLETLQAFERAVAHMTALFRTEPEVLACDTHPGYLSADWARRNAAGRPVIEVQHHHAHIASLPAEHRHDGPVIGFSFDGTGYGTDGTIWGGEILVADLAGFDRVGHLCPSLLAGGDAAVRRPYRQALARLNDAGIGWEDVLPPVAATTALEQNTLKTQLRQGLGTVQTTTMGRLFDAVASLCGVRQVISYAGQAAIELEAMVGTDTVPIDGSYAIPIDEAGEWDTRPLIKAVADDVRNDVPVTAIAAKFHGGIVQAMVIAAAAVRKTHGLEVVGLSGGVFQNLVLTAGAARALAANGFTVLTHRMVPPNDGGLALGQAAVAATRLASGRTG